MSRYIVGKETIIAISDDDVILENNDKSNGVNSLSEYRESEEIEHGKQVDVYVERKEDENGQLVLSRRKSRLLKTREALKDSYHNDTSIKGTIVSKTKGGLIADVNGQ